MSLGKIGFDKIVFTQRLSDGGIGLVTVCYGVGGLAGANADDYYVQGKRNKLGTTILIANAGHVVFWK